MQAMKLRELNEGVSRLVNIGHVAFCWGFCWFLCFIIFCLICVNFTCIKFNPMLVIENDYF